MKSIDKTVEPAPKPDYPELISFLKKDIFCWLFSGHLEPSSQLSKDLPKARLSAHCCLVEPNIELVEGIV